MGNGVGNAKKIQQVFKKYKLKVKVHKQDVRCFIGYAQMVERYLDMGGTIEGLKENRADWGAIINNQAPFDLLEALAEKALAEKQAINQNKPAGPGENERGGPSYTGL